MKSGNPIKPNVTLFWFRRDLRLEDNPGLYHALKSPYPVLPFFLFDRTILDLPENHTDRRGEFIYNTLSELQQYPPVAMQRPISGSSTRPSRRKNSTPMAAISASGCRNGRS